MEPNDPRPADEGEPQSRAADDALRRLEDRLDRASDAAERLIAEAAARVAQGAREATTASNEGEPTASSEGDQHSTREGNGGAEDPPGRPPPAGWQVPGSSQPAADSDLLIQLIHSLRDLIPPELQQRLAEALREVLLALRALIDWYLERVERRRAEPIEVQDIPIS